ncbi:hypothetical protein ACH5RR_013918 [Cinchona calisaya]|uniref:Zinc finger family protein n=1 Tax=Cinchona calisaya TaxID=153742 RepID=A0ABD3A1D9_9GENT
MVLGWRRAFCTSIPKKNGDSTNTSNSSSLTSGNQDKITTTTDDHQSNTTTPRLITSKLRFFSNPSTPRLRCRTSTTKTTTITTPPPADQSPKLQAKNSPRFFKRCSISSSPRSPFSFSLLKSTLLLSKTKCGICLHSIKGGQGTVIITAECSHSFHFPCVSGHVRNQGSLTCPVCNSTWTEMPFLSLHKFSSNHKLEKEEKMMESPTTPKPPSSNSNKHLVLKVYNDDEPLLSPICGARFNPIPESDENDEDDENIIGKEEFQGFYRSKSPTTALALENVETRMLPDAAVVSVGRNSQSCVVVLKIRAPPAPTMKPARRAPIDLVTVLDVSGRLTDEKLHMMKRVLRLVVSSLSAADRLSIVAFSSTSKRLLPLRRMTMDGRRAARRIVEAIVSLDGTATGITNDAIKKAAKVLEDRREKNPVASIILLSNASIDDRSVPANQQSSILHTTRFTHFEFPVISVGLDYGCAYGHAPPSGEAALAQCIGGLLSVMVQDLRIHLRLISGSIGQPEIVGVYSFTGRPAALGSDIVLLGGLYAEEERELLVELKVPSPLSSVGSHHVLSVRWSYKDPSTQVLIQGKEQSMLVPRPQAVRSSSTPKIQRLRSLFVATRAVAESRRLVEKNDLAGAHHMLSSARALILQTSSMSADEFVRGLDAELSELHWRRQNQVQQIRRRYSPTSNLDEKSSEPLTPTSAWKAAEKLAKVAIMKKSMNRVSDLHGFENARF